MADGRKLAVGELVYFGFLHLFRGLTVCMVIASWIVIGVNITKAFPEYGLPLTVALIGFGAVFSLVAYGLFWFAGWMEKKARADLRAAD